MQIRLRFFLIITSAFVFAPLLAQEPFYLAPGTLAPFGLDSLDITALSTEPQHGFGLRPISDVPLFAGTRDGGAFAILPFVAKSKWQSIGFSGKTISCLNVRHFSVGPFEGITLQASVAYKSDSTREYIANGSFPQPPYATDTSWRSADNDTAKKTLHAVYCMAGANENSPVVGMNKPVEDLGAGVVAGGSHGVMRLQLNTSDDYPQITLDSVVVNSLVEDLNNSGLILAGGSLNGKPVIYRSTNSGLNWNVTSFSSYDSGTVNTMGLVTGNQVDTMYAGTNGGFWISEDGGKTWGQMFLDGPWDAMAVDQVHSFSIFAALKNFPGFFQGRDGGNTWRLIGQTSVMGEVNAMVVMYSASIDSLPYVFLGTMGRGVWVYRPTDGKTHLSKPLYYLLAKGDMWEFVASNGDTSQLTIVGDTIMSDGYKYANMKVGQGHTFQRIEGDSVFEYYADAKIGFVKYDFSSELGETWNREFGGLHRINIQLKQDTVFGRWLREWSFSRTWLFEEQYDVTIVDSLGLITSFQSDGSLSPTRIFGAIIDGVHYGSFTTSVSSQARDNVPRVFRLEQNYPNPFNPLTTIRYSLPHRSHVTLTVFNTLGQKVAELVNSDVDPGYHEIQFNAKNLASGVYFYRIQAGSYVETKSLLLIR